MPCWKASSLCSGTRESQPSSTRLYRFFTGMAAGGRAAASGRGPAGHPRRQRPAPQSLGAERSRGKGPGLPVPEPGRVLNERPRLRAGPRPSPRRHWPEVPSCDGGGRRRRAGARPARGRPASAGPGPVAEGERHRLSGAVPGCSGAGVSRTERR